jgi:hypothetical protein
MNTNLCLTNIKVYLYFLFKTDKIYILLKWRDAREIWKNGT